MNISGIGWSSATICWMCLIFYLSSLSGHEISQPFPLKPIPLVGHIVLFSGLAVLLLLAMRGWKFEINLRWVITVAVFSSLFGISDEYHQSFVTGRHASIVDVSVDSISSIVTATSIWIVDRFTSSRE
jgi:VanZ family protein